LIDSCILRIIRVGAAVVVAKQLPEKSSLYRVQKSVMVVVMMMMMMMMMMMIEFNYYVV